MGDVVTRTLSNGTRKHYVRYVDVDGTRCMRDSKQKKKADARTFLATVEARVRNGQVGIHEVTDEERGRKTITIAEMARRFLGEVAGDPGYAPPSIKSKKNYRRDARKNFAMLPKPFSSRAAAKIPTGDIERLRDAMTAQEYAGASVVQLLAALSKLYTWARKQGLIDCANPVSGVERPKAAQSVDYLDAAETGSLLAAAEIEAKGKGATWETRSRWPMLSAAIYGGLRKGELYGLRKSDIALEAGRLDVMRSYTLLPKSGKPRHVPIHAELARALRWWRDQKAPDCEGLVFPVEADPGRWRMGVVEDDHGLPELLGRAKCHEPADGHPWHMLRHTFASHYVMAGGSLLALQRLLGHSTPMMTQRYAHLAPDHLAGEVARMSFAPPSPAGVANMDDERRKRATNRHQP